MSFLVDTQCLWAHQKVSFFNNILYIVFMLDIYLNPLYVCFKLLDILPTLTIPCLQEPRKGWIEGIFYARAEHFFWEVFSEFMAFPGPSPPMIPSKTRPIYRV